jgi:Holliday junction resolvase
MIKTYAKGRRFEYAVRDYLLETYGGIVIRTASSKGKIDLIHGVNGKVYAYQCKTNGKIGNAEKLEFKQAAKHFEATPILAAKNVKRDIILINL